MSLLLRWAVAALGVAAAAWLVPGIVVEGGIAAYFAVALILGLVNALIRPIVRWLACALVALTLGLFLLVINAAMLLLTGYLAQQVGVGLVVDSFLDALLGSVVISLVSFVGSLLFSED
jgi:putative membrane protein